jgi:hypothetical protein
MQGLTRLIGSQKAWVVAIAIIAATVLAALGRITGEQALDLAKWCTITAAAPFAAAGSGVERFNSSGSAALSAFAAAGSAALEFSGSGTAALAPFACTAIGALANNIGSGSAALSSFAASASGSERFSGSGEAALVSFAATSAGIERFSASASAALTPFACSASGGERFVATATAALSIDQGSTFRATISFFDELGASIDLTGASAQLQIRRTIRSSDALVQADTTNGKLVIDEAAGTIELVLSSADTDMLTSSGVYSLEITYATGEPRNELSGAIHVNPRIVR